MIFTNEINPDLKSGNFTIGISDHLPSFMLIPKRNQQHLPKNTTSTNVTQKKLYRQNFILEYLNIIWEEEIKSERNDTNYSLDKFLDRMNILLDKHTPLKKVTQKKIKEDINPGYLMKF